MFGEPRGGIMFIQFSVGNYLSFREVVTFSMVASPLKEHAETHLFEANKYFKLLKIGTLYGANASGKSNLFKAMAFMAGFVENSSKDSQAEEEINVENFRLSTDTQDKPSTFEIVFIQDGIRYRYGFQVSSVKVKSEWLFQATKQAETKLFQRSGKDFEISNLFKEGKDLDTKTRDNALFLSVVAQFNGETAISILKWFKNFNVISDLKDSYAHIASRFLGDSYLKKVFVDFIKTVDLGIEDIKVEKRPFPEFFIAKDLKIKGMNLKFKGTEITEILTLHKKYDLNQQFAGYESFQMNKNESQGTQKLFSLLGPVLESLLQGKVLVIDELDSRLHPLITNFIISLFNSTEHNPHNAQLIFNTHDTNLLSNKVFRRDQIWFTEKDKFGESHLYSLVEYKIKVRNDASYEKDYLLGKYGAIPFLGEFRFGDSYGE